MNIKHHNRTRFLQIGFVAMFIMTMGMTLLQFIKPADGASSTGTCLPVSKGGTGCGAHDFFNMIYPVGSIYTSTDSANPGTKFGGTWSAYGNGRTLVGVDTGQTEFDTVEETGGAKTHTLTTTEMPSHTHTQNQHTHTFTGTALGTHNHTQNSHTHGAGTYANTNSVFRNNTGQLYGVVQQAGSINGDFAQVAIAGTSGGTTATNIAASAGTPAGTNSNTTATNQNTGGGGAHNNVQPYVTVYFWKRTN